MKLLTFFYFGSQIDTPATARVPIAKSQRRRGQAYRSSAITFCMANEMEIKAIRRNTFRRKVRANVCRNEEA
jgi:hypothetical protein